MLLLEYLYKASDNYYFIKLGFFKFLAQFEYWQSLFSFLTIHHFSSKMFYQHTFAFAAYEPHCCVCFLTYFESKFVI